MVDHTTRRLLVNGRSFQGIGWFVADGGDADSQLRNLSTQVRLGCNQIMPLVTLGCKSTRGGGVGRVLCRAFDVPCGGGVEAQAPACICVHGLRVKTGEAPRA